MKIFFISVNFFSCPPIDGSSVRTFNLLKCLSLKHEIVFVCITDARKKFKDLTQLKKYCTEIFVIDHPHRITPLDYFFNLFSTKPFFVQKRYNRKAQELIDEVLGRGDFDLIHADGLGAEQFILASRGIPKILDTRDALWLLHHREFKREKNLALKVYYWLKLLRAKRYELKAYSFFDKVVFISRADERIISSLSKGKLKTLCTIPFGVDSPAEKSNQVRHDYPSLIFTGNMSYPPNVDAVLYFTDKVYPLVKKAVPSLRFHVVGAAPPPKVKKLSERDGVTVTGWVKDISIWLRKSTVFVCPLRYGSGMKIKILEAMAMGKPIVSSPIGIEGIKVEKDKDVLVADDPDSFASCVLSLLNDKKLRETTGRNARRLAVEEYSWSKVSTEFNELYESLIQKHDHPIISEREKQGLMVSTVF